MWRLVRGDEFLGEIVIESADFPWLSGRFEPQPAFDAVKSMFDDELVLIESDAAGGMAEWERAYDRITDALSLVSPRGPVPEYLLHVQHGRAWLRWSDEPFDDE